MITISHCIESAGARYHIKPIAIERVIETTMHSGATLKQLAEKRHLYGPMAISIQWRQSLERAGFSWAQVTRNTCQNISAGAWILSYDQTARQRSNTSDFNKVSATIKRNAQAASSHVPVPVQLPQCANTYATDYHVPISMVQRVVDTVHRSKWITGVGIMGVPRNWLPLMVSSGFSAYRIRTDTCANIQAGTWILAIMDKAKESTAGSRAFGFHGVFTGRLAPLPGTYLPIITNAADYYHIPIPLVEAVIAQESGYNDHAKSSSDAMGLMQMIPSTAARMGVKNAWNPTENIWGGVRYLAYLSKEFNGNETLMLAGYNAGGNAVIKYGYKIPPFPQTQNYVPMVFRRMSLYSKMP